MTWSTGVSGAWKTVSQPSVGVAGAWKAVQSGWVGVGGVWKRFFDAVNIVGGNVSHLAIDPNDAQATYFLNNSGTETSSPAGQISNTWLGSGNASDFECRATLNSGALSFGTTGVWLALSSSRSWGVIQTSPGTAVATLTIEIRRIGTGTILDSASVSLSAEVTL